MFERYTERARQVVVLGQEEARALKHNFIGTEHLLLGLMREEEGLAARVLEGLGFEPGAVREQIKKIVGEGKEVTTGQIPFTPRAKKVLEFSLREALTLGHNYIGTEHILLGLVREPAGAGAKVIEQKATVDEVRDAVVRNLVSTSSEARQARVRTHRTRVLARAEKALGEGPAFHPALQEHRTWSLHDLVAGDLKRSVEGTLDEVASQVAKAIREAYNLGVQDGFAQGVAAMSEDGSAPA